MDKFFKDKRDSKKSYNRYIIYFNGLGWVIGESKGRKSHRNRARPRTSQTFNNKIRKLKSQYNRLSKNPKFKGKYHTFDDFLKVNPIKQMGKQHERTSTFINRKSAKKRLWGM